MTALTAIMGIAAILQGFTLDASGSGVVVLPLPADSALAMLRRVETLERQMPGVDAIVLRPDGGYDYRTVREIPFSGEMRTHFVVRSLIDEAGRLVYRTPDTSAGNWMQFRFSFSPAGEGATTVHMDLRVRLVREKGTDIHLLAPLLGEEFLSEQMRDGITDMLEVFAEHLERCCEEAMAGGTSMHGEYALVLGAILFFPLVLSIILRLRMYARFRALLKAMLVVCVVFWLWDVLATARGHWAFNPSYVLGWDLLGMPAEEWMFFPVLTFVSVFTYEAVRKVWKDI